MAEITLRTYFMSFLCRIYTMDHS